MSHDLASLSLPEKRALLARLLVEGHPNKPDIVPLSFPQERLWFIEQLDPGQSTYNVPIPIVLPASLNASTIERTLKEIVRRHETLRTTFVRQDGGPVQLIWPQLSANLQVEDLTALPPEERQTEMERIINTDSRIAFDLSRGPLFKATLIQLDAASNLLLFTAHHVIIDGWSTKLLIDEIKAIGTAYANGQESPLPKLAYQYRDHVRWQRDYLQGDVLKQHLNYWRQQLSSLPPLLTVPPDHQRPGSSSSRGLVQSALISGKAADALSRLAREAHATMFMLLLAAFKTFLFRHSSQTDIVVGAPVANRTRPEVEPLIGFFVNTVVLRTQVSSDMTFRELLARVRDVALDAYTYQDLPFEKVVEEIQPERDLSRNPLFQVAITVNADTAAHRDGAAEPAGTVPADPPLYESGTAKFDITLGVSHTPDGLMAALEARSDLFERETVSRMARRFVVLLDSIAENPDLRLGDYRLLPDAERELVTVTWNQTARPFPDQCGFHHLFEQTVDRLPDATAAEFRDASVTYRELDEWANRLAHYLQARGIQPEARIGLCMQRGLNMAAGLLGILKSGAAYLALDSNLPAERLAFMARDAGIVLVVTETAVSDQVAALGVPLLQIDAMDEVLKHYSNARPNSGVAADNLAYVIYTSGSTGKPKGILIPHRGLCNMAVSVVEDFAAEPGDRVLQVAPLIFDVSIWEMGTAWFAGAALIFATEDELITGSVIKDKKITIASYTPSVLATLSAADYPGLRLVSSLGERCTERIVSEWAPGRRLVNIYGPSETTAHCTLGELKADGTIPTIGRPIMNAAVYILDPDLNPLPIGVAGELHVASVGMARGYLNRPDLTAERFIPNPFSTEPGSRLYKSGDLARFMPDGQIDFLGRLDHQVKVRGFRIELGEIEFALMRLDDVVDAVTILREDTPNEKRLVAYVVASPGCSLDTVDMCVRLRVSLPDYMIPAAIVQLAELPRNPNGKVDRAALPAPDGGVLRNTGLVAPRSPTERRVAAIWADVLGLKELSIHDNFFDLGGHSLLATQVILRVRSAFGIEIPLRTIFQSGTVAGFCQLIEEMDSASGGQRIEAVPRAGKGAGMAAGG